MDSGQSETKYYQHGRFTVSGGTLPTAFTAYRTYGDPKNPCIVFPTCYGGKLNSKSTRLRWVRHSLNPPIGQLYMIGDDKVMNELALASQRIHAC